MRPADTIITQLISAAEDEPAQTWEWLAKVEDAINGAFDPLASAVGSVIFATVPVFGTDAPLIVFWLVLAALIFTIYFRGIQFRSAKTSIDLVRGKYSRASDPGEVTHFQALSSAVSGTVGLGNIAGVGAAVVIGGPGATFWMIVAGLLGMCTKFVECTLGVKYREVHEDGTVTGGPFKYLPVAFDRFGAVFSKGMVGIFAVALFLFGAIGGNMFQANQTMAQAREVTGGDDGFLGSSGSALIFGVILAVLVGAVILGGITSIAKVTSRLVPLMGLLYVGSCLLVILGNFPHIPGAIATIITEAFNPTAAGGGLIGVLIVGFQRAAFSNEAGIGSAPIVHSAVKTRHPVSEGYVALLEPFIDTVVVCTMTALTIVVADTNFYNEAVASVAAGGNAARWSRGDLTVLRDVPPAVPGPARGRGGAVRLLDPDHVELLHDEGVDHALRPQPCQRAHLQDDLLPLRGGRRDGQLHLGPLLRRRDALHLCDPEPVGVLPVAAEGPRRGPRLPGGAPQRHHRRGAGRGAYDDLSGRRTRQRRCRSEAQRVSSWRDDSWSLRRTEDMWVSTVLMEMKSSLATSL